MRLLPHFALIAQTLIAAGTFLVAKEATDHLKPIQLAWCRILTSFVVILPLYLVARRGRPWPTKRDMLRLALLGLCGITVNQVLFLHGIHASSPLHAALLYAFTPVMVLAAAVAFLGERLTRPRLLGVILAVTGVVLVLSGRGLDLASGPLRGDLLILMAVVAWSAYTLLGKPVLKRHDALTVTTWAFAFGAASLLLMTPWAIAELDVSAVSWQGWFGVLYLAVMTSVVSFTLWYWALRFLDATQVAVYTNLQPPATALLAWWLLAEVPTWQVIVGGIMVMVGVTVTQLSGRLRYKPTATTEVARPFVRSPQTRHRNPPAEHVMRR